MQFLPIGSVMDMTRQFIQILNIPFILIRPKFLMTIPLAATGLCFSFLKNGKVRFWNWVFFCIIKLEFSYICTYSCIQICAYIMHVLVPFYMHVCVYLCMCIIVNLCKSNISLFSTGRRIFLHFEAVDSAFYTWVNGVPVGYRFVNASLLISLLLILFFLYPGIYGFVSISLLHLCVV